MNLAPIKTCMLKLITDACKQYHRELHEVTMELSVEYVVIKTNTQALFEMHLNISFLHWFLQ